MKKTVHIISHSHLDREWYMPFEAHRMRVVELMDTVLDLFDNDPEFKYFHLDGHTLPLDDYLEVRPNQRDKVQSAINDGKLRVGPYYILQDAFLISEEANVRNALIGSQELAKWGTKGEQVGYFPDTFGLSGQIPQIVKETGMAFATFGRGVTPTGFNNTTGANSNFQSTYSEMNWQSPNGDQVLGILFANWYSNGNEIPTDREKAKLFWDKKLADAERFAATEHLLMMNGCDHQPVQADVSKAIKVANELYPDYEFIHSNFTNYFESLPKEILNNLSVVKGELRSQETDGWYTLANTASNRIHLKQRSHELSQRLEQVVEPLSVIAHQYGYRYPKDKIDFVWKLLLQNYPHDSICACSVDEVIKGMETRFDQAESAINYLEDELSIWLGQYDFGKRPQEAVYTFQIWNTTTSVKSGIAKVKIEVDRCQFNEAAPVECFKKMEEIELANWKVVDGEGLQYVANIVDLGVHYHYDLPKDAFRIPYMARYIQVEVPINQQEPLSVKQLYLVLNEEKKLEEVVSKRDYIENKWVKVLVNSDGMISITDKMNQRVYNRQCVLEDTGDAGNEYIFKEAKGERIYSIGKLADIQFEKTIIAEKLIVTYKWQLPQSADEQLKEEQRRVIDITNRVSGRSNQLVEQLIQVTYQLSENDRAIRMIVEGKNEVKDHRIRMLWQLPKSSVANVADSHYEIVTRKNQVSKEWKNPSNPQVSRHAVSISNESGENIFGITIASKGNYEYEVVSNEEQGTVLAVTLLRCTGEMGDWGYFPTPGAQSLHDYQSELAIILWEGDNEQVESIINARYQFIDLLSYAPVNQLKRQLQQVEVLPLLSTVFKKQLPDSLVITAVKQAKDSDNSILRMVNFSGVISDIREYIVDDVELQPLNLLEDCYDNVDNRYRINHHQIQTYKILRSE